MIKPNFFIVGAPKCGTSALMTYLSSHPKVFMSSPKEPHYFAEEVRGHFYPANSQMEYLALFKDASSQQTIIGESSVLYLFFENAIQRIYDFNSDAKLVVMLRNPVDLAYSWHSQAVYNSDENIEDFETAWNLQESRKNGKNISKLSRMPITLQYNAIASLGSQVERLLSIYPKEQVHFIFLESFNENPQKEYQKVLNFLNIADDGKMDFPIVNQNKTHKIKKLGSLNRTNFAKNVRSIKNRFGFKNVALMANVNRWNVIEEKRKPLRAEFRADLVENFNPQVEILEKILEKDLSHWKK